MKNYKTYFKNKKITIMGLGLLGRGLGYTKFLAECGAKLTVTDLKTKAELASSLKALSKYKNITFVLGKHRLEDFRNKDMVIKAAGVPLDSPHIQEAKKNKIPVEMDASFFATLAPEVTVIGVTGTRGKTMTTTLIYEILKKNEKLLKQKVYIGGNIRGGATLPLLGKAKKGDIVVLELDSWQLQGFGDAKLSPQISVFTSFMPDHMNYYKDDLRKYFADKTAIFKYQKKGDTLVIRPEVKKLIPKGIKSELIIAKAKDVEKYDFVTPGVHQRENLACAVQVAKLFKIPDVNIKKAVKNFKGVEGRLQYVKTVAGVKIYNDNNATTPEATVAGLEALSDKKKPARLSHSGGNIILIAGGADKGLNLEPLMKAVNMYCKDVVLLDGTGTQKLITKLKAPYKVVSTLREAAELASGLAKRGDIVLFSPAFASFGMFTNEYDRNDQFMKLVRKLK
jgi:UDP-N-acetylmuramoylalanine--D-glutamate ligase